MASRVPQFVPKRESKPRAPKGLVHERLSADDVVCAAKPWIIERESGIYFLIKDGAIVYVGQSVNVVARIITHVPDKEFDSWHWVPCPPNMLDSLERYYIDTFMPPLNQDYETKIKRRNG